LYLPEIFEEDTRGRLRNLYHTIEMTMHVPLVRHRRDVQAVFARTDDRYRLNEPNVAKNNGKVMSPRFTGEHAPSPPNQTDVKKDGLAAVLSLMSYIVCRVMC
jgi:hypothetical protein